MLMLMSRNRKCEPDNISISININISITKQQYLILAEIQAKIVPNPALISSFKMASSSLNMRNWQSSFVLTTSTT